MAKKKKKKSKFKKLLKELDTNSKFSMFEVLIIVLISILFGIIIGYVLTYASSSINLIRNDSNLEDIVFTYDKITNSYYKNVDKKKLSEAAISGMTNYLGDPNTMYMNENITDTFNESVDGYFVGIGVTIQFDGEYNKVIKVNKNGPADKAGMKKNDIILSVDGTDCKDLYGSKISNLIKGKKGTTVNVKVKRGEEEVDLTIKRDKVDVESVIKKTFDVDGKKIGYIRITAFSSNTYDQFEKALDSLEKKKIDSLIIDVRSNPGGYLETAKKILSKFFNKKTVLYQIEDSKSNKKKIYSSSREIRKYPIVLLGDESSASASEVIISCFKDNYKDASFVGMKTFGKGTIQDSQSLKSGNTIKYTTDRWLTSKGKNIDGKGLKPDYEVELDDSYLENPSDDNDNQLQKAIELLKESH